MQARRLAAELREIKRIEEERYRQEKLEQERLTREREAADEQSIEDSLKYVILQTHYACDFLSNMAWFQKNKNRHPTVSSRL